MFSFIVKPAVAIEDRGGRLRRRTRRAPGRTPQRDQLRSAALGLQPRNSSRFALLACVRARPGATLAARRAASEAASGGCCPNTPAAARRLTKPSDELTRIDVL
jgi:alkylhydroperoxidase family enzyme